VGVFNVDHQKNVSRVVPKIVNELVTVIGLGMGERMTMCDVEDHDKTLCCSYRREAIIKVGDLAMLETRIFYVVRGFEIDCRNIATSTRASNDYVFRTCPSAIPPFLPTSTCASYSSS